jgi:hypothetical protein
VEQTFKGIPDVPVLGDLRIAIQLSCGCQSALDFPLTFFNDALNNGVPQNLIHDFVIGFYGADLFSKLVEKHHDAGEACPVSYDAAI